MKKTQRSRIKTAFGAIFITLAAVLIFTNLFPSQKILDYEIKSAPAVGTEEFNQMLGHLLGPPLLAGNKVEAYYNGRQIFPAMLQAIRSAQKTITMEAYFFWSDSTGRRFINALVERARAGVRVHLLVDWLGHDMDQEVVEELKKAGVEYEIYRKPNFWNLTQLNNRSHRRILVIDGRVGFTGGVGISDAWDGEGNEPTVWRDSQYRVEGPIVNSLQNAFMDNWLKIREEILHGPSYFPSLQPQGPTSAQIFKSSPEAGSESVRLMYQLILASARKSIRLASAYFLPSKVFIREMIKARERGVRVEIIVPGPYLDTKIVQNASRAHWGELLKAGVEIYQFQPAQLHCKVLIVDDLLVSVGSTNFDNRSFLLNDEANLNLLDPAFAAQESRTFENDKRNSRKVTFEEWESRPQTEKWMETLSRLIENQL